MLGGILRQVTLLHRNTRCLLESEVLRTVFARMDMSITSDSSKPQEDCTKAAGGNEAIKRSIDSVEETDGGLESKKMKISAGNAAVEAPSEHGGLPYKKKKVAMLLSYCGKGYLGMQRNPGILTIESVLLEALVKAGVVRQDHIENPGEKMRFQRAARTDKGVSAAGQICSLKINVENPEQKINAHLPPEMKVQSIKRTTQGFDCKQAAAARTYLYMIPTFAFTPITEHVVETYRITDDILEKINEVLANFLGTHNFHNFTSGKKPTDHSARRYIMQFSIGKPFIKEGLEFAVVRVKGQSFILHQIRKMMGITIAIVRGFTNTDVLQKCWGPERVDVPIAPGLGLVLDRLHYDYYNKKFGNDGSHVPLEWDEIKEQIEEFTENYIYKTIIETELKEKSMMKWLSTLPLHKLDIIEEDGPRHNEIGLARNKLLLEKRLAQEKLAAEDSQENRKSEERSPENKEIDGKRSPIEEVTEEGSPSVQIQEGGNSQTKNTDSVDKCQENL